MPDITMCKGKGCNMTNSCYRFKAIPNKYGQSYFTESPIKEDDNCDYYWEIKQAINKL